MPAAGRVPSGRAAIRKRAGGNMATDIRAGSYRQRGRRYHGNRCRAARYHQGGGYRQARSGLPRQPMPARQVTIWAGSYPQAGGMHPGRAGNKRKARLLWRAVYQARRARYMPKSSGLLTWQALYLYKLSFNLSRQTCNQ